MARPQKQKNDAALSKLVAAVAKNVKGIREKKGMTQKDLAKKSCVAVSTISEIENERVDDLQLSTITALALPLGVDHEVLLSGINFPVDERDIREFVKACDVIQRIKMRITRPSHRR